MTQNSSIIHDITSIARCKCQQNVLTTEIKIKTSNKKYSRNKKCRPTKNCKQSQRYTSRFTTNNTRDITILCVCCCVTAVLGITK